jgi:hypothetical protein
MRDDKVEISRIGFLTVTNRLLVGRQKLSSKIQISDLHASARERANLNRAYFKTV